MRAIRLVTVSGAADLETEIAEELASINGVDLYMRCVDRVELLAAIRAGAIDAIVLCGWPSWLDAQCLDEASERSLKVCAIPRDPLDERELARWEVQALPVGTGGAEIMAAVRGKQAPPPPAPSSGAGRITAVWGPKGAPGRTTIAAELARMMAVTEPGTLLMDCDPFGGDLKQALGVVDDVPTVIWAARLAARAELDASKLSSELRRVGDPGPVLLCGLPRPGLWTEVSDHGFKRSLQALRAHFTTIVADAGFSLEEAADVLPDVAGARDRMTRTLLAEADRVIAVFRPDPIGVRNLAVAFDRLVEVADRDRITLVGNGVTHGTTTDVSDLLQEHIGCRCSLWIPFAPEEAIAARTQGRFIAEVRPNGSIARAVTEVAQATGIKAPRRGLLTRLGGRG